ncbi:MAG: Holliday junction DNA helicase RuvA [Parcubacteria group bacterium RIFCSPLOWO2_01_FULL_48_18]|nr:MAG: Holliday junction DNA helicase RuvA [Parcubacteria group bacterium RIFCSPLOWO2_01_FULL_48_18]
MLYSLSGKLIEKKKDFVVAEAGGIGFKVFTSRETANHLPQPPANIKLFCYLYLREDRLELYGFRSEEEMRTFELLNSVTGIGPKSALGILGIASLDRLKAAIAEGKNELLTRASGIGHKTAERIILELKDKISEGDHKTAVEAMESDLQVEEALTALGYPRPQARETLRKVSKETQGIEARLKEALKILSKK